MLAFGFKEGTRCIIGGVERAEMSLTPANRDASLESSSPEPHAKKAELAVGARAAGILPVHGRRDIPQVDDPVVGAVAVNVVDIVRRPCAVHIQPRQPMSQITLADDPDVPVPWAICCSGNSSDCGPRMPFEPLEDAAFWIVVKQLAQALRGKIVSSHDAPLMLIGQRPAAIHSRLSASLL